MRMIQNHTTDAALNLALEEYCLLHLEPDPDCLLMYVNDPVVVIGRNQNPLEEVDFTFAAARGIPVVRRISGGGAVFHDPGNLNFSFLSRPERDRTAHYRRMTRPIRDALREMGVAADWNRRNDLVVAGCKISGNAHYLTPRRMISHGTLLFDSDLGALSSALGGTFKPIATKSIASVRAKVANILQFLPEPMSIGRFRDRLVNRLADAHGPLNAFRFGSTDWERIRELADRKYRRWEWTMGKTPEFVYRVQLQLGDECVSLEIRVVRGVVRDVTAESGKAVGGWIAEAVRSCRFEITALTDRLTSLEAFAVGAGWARAAALRILGLG
ncbi:MAG: lipoate--protein ligase family protein [Desulfobacterales bacterium]